MANDSGVPRRRKKKLDAALEHYAKTQRGIGPLYAVFLAQNINRFMGGAFVAAWDVPYLDEATVDLFVGLGNRAAQTPNLTQNVRAVEAFKEHYRRNFYRKH